MGMPGAAASGASIASLGFSAAATVAKGMGTQAGYEMQASRLERAAGFGRLQAELTDTSLREQLNTTLGNIDAIRAAARIDPSSPTSVALAERQNVLGERERTSKALSIRSQISENEAGADYLHKAGGYALLMSSLGAAGQVLGGVGKGLDTFGASDEGFYGGSPETNPRLRKL